MTDAHLVICILGIAMSCVTIGRSMETPRPPGHALASLVLYVVLLVLGILIGGRP